MLESNYGGGGGEGGGGHSFVFMYIAQVLSFTNT